mmetsp:Transcript_86175/g.152569  ORF Transcript_86175/g.152569 Transcript_86175/m.152569 type:complete len:286 (+) Transcript_86175:50-907(+)
MAEIRFLPFVVVMLCCSLPTKVYAKDPIEDVSTTSSANFNLRGHVHGDFHSSPVGKALSSAWKGVADFAVSTWKELNRPAYEGDELDVSLEDVLHSVSNTKMQSCSVVDHSAFHFSGARFDTKSLTVHAHGSLPQEILAGNVSVSLKLNRLRGNITALQRLKRRMKWTLGQQRYTREPLCSNLERAGSLCPLNEKRDSLQISVSNLPHLQIHAAGEYSMEVHLLDDHGSAVTCLRLDLPTAETSNVGSKTAAKTTTTTTTYEVRVSDSGLSASHSLWEPWHVVRV